MTTSLYQGFGGLSLPADAGSGATTLTALDPARAVLAGLFEAAINAELGTAWTQVTAGTVLDGTDPVEDVLELPPTGPNMKQRKAAWPLLCVYRDGAGTFEQHAINGQVERLIQPWTVDYIVGPLEIGNVRKLGDIFQAVVKVVRLVIRKRGHPAYQSGALQFFPGHGYIGAIDLKSYDGPPHYQARFAGSEDGTVYHAVSMHLETAEYSRDLDGQDGVVDAMDLQVNGGGGEGLIGALVTANTDAPFQYG